MCEGGSRYSVLHREGGGGQDNDKNKNSRDVPWGGVSVLLNGG